MVEGLIGTWSGVARRPATMETRLFGRADKVWGRLSVSLQEEKNSVLDGPRGHVNCASGSCGHGYDTTTRGPHRHAISNLQRVASHKYFEWRGFENSVLASYEGYYYYYEG